MLLDEAFAISSVFVKLKKKANVLHVQDCGYSRQIEDKDIYNEAVKRIRFVATINYKDFRKFVRKGKSGVIGIPSGLTNNQIDELLANFVSKSNPEEYIGKATKLTDKKGKIN